MITARVDVRRGWGAELAKRGNLIARDSLEEASEVGAYAAGKIASARSRARPKMKNVQPIPVRPMTDGWEGGFRSQAGINGEFYSGYQSRGTLGARTRKVKASTQQRRESPTGKIRHAKVAGRKGITPLRHEEQGLEIARRHLKRLLDQRL